MERQLAVLSRAIVFLALVVPFAVAGACVEAAAYPTKPVTLIVPFPPGGRTDLTARLVAQHLDRHLGGPVVIVNKAGAGGVLGAKEVSQARPDGHTLGFFSTAVVTAQYTVPTPTDLRDYEAVSVVNVDPAAIAVQEKAPWKTVAELVEFGRKNPGKIRIGMIPGASAQVFAGGFAKAAGIQVIYVPFKGDADGAVALAGGHIEAHVAVPVSYKALTEAKKVRILGVAADKRSSLYKDIPTFRENGVDLVIASFHAMFAPKGTPGDVLSALETALEKTMKEKEVNDQMAAAGLGAVYLNRRDGAAFIAQQDATYKALIEELGMMVSPKK